jgi:hypothetical protein
MRGWKTQGVGVVRFGIADRDRGGSLMKGRKWELCESVGGGGCCWLILLAYLSGPVQREPLNGHKTAELIK